MTNINNSKLFNFPKLDINNIVLKPDWLGIIDWTKGSNVLNKTKNIDNINNKDNLDNINNTDNKYNLDNINNTDNLDNVDNVDNVENTNNMWGYYKFPYYNETVEFIKKYAINNTSQYNQNINENILENNYNRFNIKKQKKVLPPAVLYSIAKEKEIDFINKQLLKNANKDKLNNINNDNDNDNYSETSDNINIDIDICNMYSEFEIESFYE